MTEIAFHQLIFELGFEEMPSVFAEGLHADFRRLVQESLAEARLEFHGLEVLGTPRRLVCLVERLAERQEDRRVRVQGPPKSVAYDAEGNPTKAAEGFAKKQGASLHDLRVEEVEGRGEYLVLERLEAGEAAETLLPGLLQACVTRMSLPKSMRWGDLDFQFVRPIHWIVALYGGRVLPVELAGVAAGRLSRGHRFAAPDEFEVGTIETYREALEKAYVIALPAERRRIIEARLVELAGEVGGAVLEDPELVTLNSHLVEYPVVLRGGFEEEFLALPEVILTTAMREHQRYFGLRAPDGSLLPYFILVANTPVPDPQVVVRGNERVLRARLADARFFFDEDRRRPLESYLEDLKNVVYHARLGTSYDKVRRNMGVCRRLADMLGDAVTAGEAKDAERATELAKCDLVTQVVVEFPKLQGVMGGIYARASKESEAAAHAVEQHYLPVEAAGALPDTVPGALASMADKVDTLCGAFGLGLIPTGSGDPLALRRQCLGVMRIIWERGWALSLSTLLRHALEGLGDRIDRPVEETLVDLMEFFRSRFYYWWTGRGRDGELVEAVLAAGFDDLTAAVGRLEALSVFRERPDFESLVETFKRVGNKIRGFTQEGGALGAVDEARLHTPSEKKLDGEARKRGAAVKECLAQGEYGEALAQLAALKVPVDEFFENDLVDDPDPAVRQCRHDLLGEVNGLFLRLADFSRIFAR